MTKELKRFEQWWDAEDDIPNNGPYTPDTPIQFAWAGWQAALAEQPAQKRPQNCGTSYCSCIECVMEPEQPAQQEPVAWINPDEQNARKAFHWVKSEEFTSPVYTPPPPQRTWVNAITWRGLTDEDVMSIAFNFDVSSLSLVAKAIEAKLKELNQ